MKNQYFEGWYYKQVSRHGNYAISLIPGISLAHGDAHSFVQYIYWSLNDQQKEIIKTGYCKYPLEDFSSSDAPFGIRIADNRFSETELSVKLADERLSVEGTLNFGPYTPIQTSLTAPNIMGYFAYIPKMECYHGIISMNHTLSGILTINGLKTDFGNGKGYLEKDWGTSFPKRYIWLQSNHFQADSTSFICSVADIPFMRRQFLGFICNLVIGHQEYRFATYDRSRLQIESLSTQKIVLVLENHNAKLKVEAIQSGTGELSAPVNGRMQGIIKEGISGIIKLRLYNHQGAVIYEDTGNMAGIERLGF